MFLYPQWIIALLKAAIGAVLLSIAIVVIGTVLRSIYFF
jgi:hypothetical protein